jgi:hypothetical protein
MLTLYLEGRYGGALPASSLQIKNVIIALYLSNTCLRQFYTIREITDNNYLHRSTHFCTCNLAFHRCLNYYSKDENREISETLETSSTLYITKPHKTAIFKGE